MFNTKNSTGYQAVNVPKQGDRNKPSIYTGQQKDKAPLVKPAPNKK